MQPSLDKLQKFLKLETERGYDNRAIVGGLNKILGTWETEARVEKVPESIIQAVTSFLTGYHALSPEERAQGITQLRQQLGFRRESPKQRLSPRPRSPQEVSRVQEQLSQGNPGNGIAPGAARPSSGDERRSHTPSRNLRKVIDNEVQQGLGLNAPLTVITGIGPKHAQTLETIGLRTLGDLLYYFPRRYDDYSQLKPINNLFYGEEVTVIGTVQSISTRPIRGGASSIVEAVISDGTGALRLTWFNQPWLANRMQEGMPISVSGRIDQYLGRIMMTSPAWEPLDQELLHTNRIIPIYPLTARITQNWLRRIIDHTVRYWAPRVPDYLPESIRQSAGLLDLPTALMQVHRPDSQEQLNKARERLAYDEIFLLQLGVMRQKRTWKEATARVFEIPPEWLADQIKRLPFSLTGAQEHAIEDICKDLASGQPMNRLLQGDVGSGKTVVAAMGVAAVVRSGSQAAIMAPTSILAEQHYRNLVGLFCPTPENPDPCILQPEQVRLLIGDTPDGEKLSIRQSLEDGSIKVIVGTHALIEDSVNFQDLQLVVVDEQHRFGVEQRAALRLKGSNPHLLVMTATPIPRSLALTVYGDLDLSVMDEMPAGRQAIETHVVFPQERERAYSLIRSQVAQGHQAFIIYPLVEQGEKEESKAAVEEHARLQTQVFPNLHLGLLHGRMKPEEKEQVMTQFRDNGYHVLISTSVVEVGVDIPNATVMLIEGANRFGLAQLHQFRGRVGRGEAKSFCLLVPETASSAENERLSAMVETNDGFILAQRDLEQRGPGEFLGTRQSGYAELQMATLTDVRLIEKARLQAQAIFENDPTLSSQDYSLLRESLRRFWGGGRGDIS